ncbi:chemotaxis protein CheA [Notoacmeibacter sp. MSK16QG-6]|uniref:chemotaxis protein CheA n=1 Tax=Notoacmeibacter sp. MSK16QG-6 TaxID=2957982 RepID=UPI00209CE754|nr:chemotaxis protein CheA [Notoacmeibacter sp. MSK16QG-6]MCP1200897.1 chemotaxis protein CheA [Notoacmeibacter sp. MSK16QG-6]
MDLDSIKVTFFQECADQLAEVEQGFMTLQSDPEEVDCVHAIFRAIHSIKGGAGAFGFTELVEFAHKVENGLDVIRNEPDPGRDPRLDLIASACDQLSDVIAATRDGGEIPDTSDFVAKLSEAFAGDISDEPEPEIEFDAVPIDLTPLSLEEAAPAGTTHTINIKPTLAFYQRGNDVQKLARNLSELGELSVETDSSQVPNLSGFDSTKTYLCFTLRLTTESPDDEVSDIIEWCEGDCEITHSIDAPDGGASDDMPDLDNLLAGFESAEGDDDEAETSTGEEPEIALEAVTAPVAEIETLPSPEANLPSREAKEPTPAQKDKPATLKTSPTIRVESDRVDRLINLMGEAVISQAMLAQSLSTEMDNRDSPSQNMLREIERLMREIQESVMAIRAQPVKPVFMRMSRIVREACSHTGKKAVLALEGENTEVDTTVIEGLSDPLTHMIRNAIDHGIETPEDRRAKGKDEQGTIKLSACHQSGRIVVSVEDDGAGLNRERLVKKATEKGIIEPGAELSESEIDNLIFAPGFSTAEQLTDLSGRGVGMDVVRQSIQALGGRVSISSNPGHGTQIRLSLPLTLAILDGMVVRAADEVFIVPLSCVLETLSVAKENVHDIGGKPVVKVRDTLVPVINIAARLGFRTIDEMPEKATLLIVESQSGASAALLVDQFDGQQQFVIKSLEANFGRVSDVSAATILGTGRIALILDVDEILETALGLRQNNGSVLVMERAVA